MPNLYPMSPLIQQYIDDVTSYEKFLKSIPNEGWHYKPAPDRWSAHEIVIHVTDSEVNGFIRLRKALAENGAPIVAYEQDLWANELHYKGMDREASLRLFRILREMNYALLLQLKEPDWKKTYLHPEAGSVTIEKWLETYVNHLNNHIKQIQKNLEGLNVKVN